MCRVVVSVKVFTDEKFGFITHGNGLWQWNENLVSASKELLWNKIQVDARIVFSKSQSRYFCVDLEETIGRKCLVQSLKTNLASSSSRYMWHNIDHSYRRWILDHIYFRCIWIHQPSEWSLVYIMYNISFGS